MTEDRRESQSSWNGFAEQLKELGDKLLGPTGARGPRERAEAFRYLIGLLAAAQELEIEADRGKPRLTRMFTPMRSFIADGVDTLYHEAKLDASHTYECTVRRGDDLFFSIAVYASDDDGMREMVSHLIDQDIELDGETARIELSKDRTDGARNWLELKGNEPFVLVRQYFPESVVQVDEGRYREAKMAIRCLDPPSTPDAYAPEDLALGLDRALRFMHDTVDGALAISAYVDLNRLEHETQGTTPTRIDAQGNLVVDEERHDEHTAEEVVEMVDPRAVANNLPGPGIGYIGASYRLADDEAILVEGERVRCRYWSCQLLNHFLQSGDYWRHQVSLNDRQIHYEADGSFRIYASRTNPGVRNWLDTEGRRRGQIVLRTLLAETDLDAKLSIVKISDIPERDRA